MTLNFDPDLNRIFLVNNGYQSAVTKSKSGENSKSYILTPPHQKDNLMSVKREEHLYEFTLT